MFDTINKIENKTLEPRVFAIAMNDPSNRTRIIGLETGYIFEEALLKVYNKAVISFPTEWGAFKPYIFTSEKIKDLAMQFPLSDTTIVPTSTDIKIENVSMLSDKSKLIQIVIDSPASESLIDTFKQLFTSNEIKFIQDKIKENGKTTKRQRQRKDSEDSSMVQ